VGRSLGRRILSQLYCTLSRPTSEDPTGAISQTVQQVHRMVVGGCDRWQGGHKGAMRGPYNSRQWTNATLPLPSPLSLIPLLEDKNYYVQGDVKATSLY
jgi:hypothetical protein